MKLDNKEKLVFITMGVTALNMALMANGIETMPNMWVNYLGSTDYRVENSLIY